MTISFSGDAFRAVSQRWAHVRGDRLAAAFQDASSLDAVMAFARVPGKATVLRALPVAKKAETLEDHFRYLQRASASEWYEQPLAEMWAAHLFKADIDDKTRAEVFFPVALEAALGSAVEAWLRGAKLAPCQEVQMGLKRADWVGYAERNPWRLAEERIVTVELKNDLTELDRLFAQLSEYRRYSTRTYVAVTPSFYLHYCWRHMEAPAVQCWDSKALETRLAPLGTGLLVVERAEVIVAREAKEVAPGERERRDVRNVIERQQSMQPQTGTTP
jgi:hypothetical protein